LNKQPWLCDICGASNPYEFGECDHGRTTSHRRRIFSLSLGDWLDDEVPIEWLARNAGYHPAVRPSDVDSMHQEAENSSTDLDTFGGKCQ